MKSFQTLILDIFNRDSYKDSISEYLGDRVSSPFFLSFIISWSIHNYKLVIGPFLWVKEDGCGSRFQFLQCLVRDLSYCDILFYPLIYSLVAVILFYSLDTIYKGLRLAFKRRLEPVMVDFASKGADVFTKEMVDTLYNEKKALQNERSKLIDELYTANDNAIKAGNEQKEAAVKLEKAQEQLAYRSDYETLKSKATDLDRQVTLYNQSIVTLKSLSGIFKDVWVCEFHYQIKGKVEVYNNAELFEIKNSDYIIRDAEVHFKIEDAMLFYSDFLRFSKIRSSRITHVKLTRITANLWCGYESMPDDSIAYVRYYSNEQRPGNSLTLSPKPSLPF